MDCASTIDVTDDEEIHQDRHSYASVSKHHSNNSNANAAPGLLPTTTSVHELLECPVCTNSMYPPIHQVSFNLFVAWIFALLIGFRVFLCVCSLEKHCQSYKPFFTVSLKSFRTKHIIQVCFNLLLSEFAMIFPVPGSSLC